MAAATSLIIFGFLTCGDTTKSNSYTVFAMCAICALDKFLSNVGTSGLLTVKGDPVSPDCSILEEGDVRW